MSQSSRTVLSRPSSGQRNEKHNQDESFSAGKGSEEAQNLCFTTREQFRASLSAPRYKMKRPKNKRLTSLDFPSMVECDFRLGSNQATVGKSRPGPPRRHTDYPSDSAFEALLDYSGALNAVQMEHRRNEAVRLGRVSTRSSWKRMPSPLKQSETSSEKRHRSDCDFHSGRVGARASWQQTSP